MACARLHNFIINGDQPFEREICSVEEENDPINLLPDPMASLDLDLLYLPVVPDEIFLVYPGISHSMEAIVEFLRDIHNIERKRRDLAGGKTELTVLSPIGMEWDREFVSPS
ncbi:hypothetical protein ACHAW6_011110 [Cyclotella cf. meneghiniana]